MATYTYKQQSIKIYKENADLIIKTVVICLLLSGTLIVGKQYNLANLFIFLLTIAVSFYKPVFGILISIAYFTCDQFVEGATNTAFPVGRYLIFINVLMSLPLSFKAIKNMPLICKIQYGIYLFLFIIGVVSLLWAPNTERAIYYIGKFGILILWSCLSLHQLSNKNMLSSLSVIFSSVTSIIALVILFGEIGRLSHINDRLLLEGIGINSLATSFGFTIIFSIFYLISTKSNWKKIIIIGIDLLIYLSIIKMGTRSIVLGVPLACLLGLFAMRPRKMIKSLFIFSVILIITGTIFYIAASSNLISSRLVDRYIGLAKVKTFKENSRLNLARYSFLYIIEHPTGTGVGNENRIFNDYKYKVRLFESHNTFISTMVQFGIGGLFLLILSKTIMLISIVFIGDSSHRSLCITMYFYFIICLMKASILQTRLYWIPLTILMSFIGLNSWIEQKEKVL